MSPQRRSPPKLDVSKLVSVDSSVSNGYRVDSFVARTLSGGRVDYDASSSTPLVVVFVKDACDGCDELVSAMANPVGTGLIRDEQVLLATKAVPSSEYRRGLERCADAVTVVVGQELFDAFGVSSAPFFVVVHAGDVVSEGVPFGVAHLVGLLDMARDGRPVIEVPRLR